MFLNKKEVFWRTASSILQGFLNTIEKNEPIEKIFDGKILKENIYEKALKWIERKEAKTTTITLDKLVFTDTEIPKSDIINILYNTNKNFKRYVDKTCKDCEKDNEKREIEIQKSYTKILNILKARWLINGSNTAINRDFVNKRINNQFQIVSENELSLEEFDEATIWEDLFMNGVADDSEYDLLIDIQNIWNILFESFVAPIEMVFYWYPWNYHKTNEISTLDLLKQNVLNEENNGTTATRNTTNTTGDTIITGDNNNEIFVEDENNNGTTKSAFIEKSAPKENTLDTDDPALKEFFTKNKVFQKATTQWQKIQWDICRIGVDWWMIEESEEEQEVDEEILEGYLKSTQINIEKQSTIYPENENIKDVSQIFYEQSKWTGENKTWSNAIANTYIESLLSGKETEDCMKECKNLPITERTICEIQCLCFTRSRQKSNDPRTQSMNDMLKLRFCTVPAKNLAIPRGKDIYSLDEILNRINSVMDNLINWWEMVKYQRTKEVLENPIADFSLSKIISFQVNINSKPIFNTKTIKEKQETKKNDLQKINATNIPQQEKNKYLIIYDPIKEEVSREFTSSLQNFQEKEHKKRVQQAQKEQMMDTEIKKMENPIIEKKGEVFNTFVEFLDKNVYFRQKMEEELLNINTTVEFLNQQF